MFQCERDEDGAVPADGETSETPAPSVDSHTYRGHPIHCQDGAELHGEQASRQVAQGCRMRPAASSPHTRAVSQLNLNHKTLECLHCSTECAHEPELGKTPEAEHRVINFVSLKLGTSLQQETLLKDVTTHTYTHTPRSQSGRSQGNHMQNL